MWIDWEYDGEKGGFPCRDGAFFAGLRLSFKGHTAVTMMNVFEILESEKQALLGFGCHTVEQNLPNGAVLCAYVLWSDNPALREITDQYAGKVYVEITVGGARIAVVNKLRDKPMEE